MGGLYFASGIDKGFETDLNRINSRINQFGNNVADTGRQIDNTFKNMATAAGSFFAVQQASSFVQEVIKVRGEVQQLDVALTTMLGSKSRANDLIQKSIDLAAKTPFELSEVTQGAKSLLAYGSSATNVVEELKMLGNVASGISAPLNDIVYLYGTLQTQGVAYSQDIKQFAGRGIPIYKELAKVLGITQDKVQEFVSQGKVGFSEVQQAFKNMTSEGGMFNNLMEEQSKTISGRMSNISDQVYQMFNKIGESSEGAINSAIDGVVFLLDNYEQLGKLVFQLVSVYGAYRAALIVTAQVQKIMAIEAEKALVQQKLMAMEATAASTAQSLAAKGTTVFTLATRSLAGAMKSVTAAIASNPIGLVATGIAVALPLLMDWNTESDKQDESIQSLDESMSSLNTTIGVEKTNLDLLFKQLRLSNAGTEKRSELVKRLNDQYPEYNSSINLEKASLEELATAQTEYNAQLEEKLRIQARDSIMANKTKKAAELSIKLVAAEIELDQIRTQVPEATTGNLPDLKNLFAVKAYGRFNKLTKDVEVFKAQYQVMLEEIQRADEYFSNLVPDKKIGKATKGVTDEERKAALESLDLLNQEKINALREAALKSSDDQVKIDQKLKEDLLANELWYLGEKLKLQNKELDQVKTKGDQIDTQTEIKNTKYLLNKKLQEELDNYKTYDEKRSEIENKYSEINKKLIENGYANRLKSSNQDMRDEYDALDKSLLEKSELYQAWLLQLPDLLKGKSKEIQKELDSIDLKLINEKDQESIVIYKAEIAKLQEELKKLVDGTEKINSSWKDSMELLPIIEDITNGLINSFSGLSEENRNLLQSLSSVIGGLHGVVTAYKAVEKASNSLEKSTAILAIISATVKVIGSIIKAQEKSQEIRIDQYIKETERVTELNTTLQKLADTQKFLYNVVSKNVYEESLKGLIQYNKALGLQDEALKQIIETNKQKIYTQSQDNQTSEMLNDLEKADKQTNALSKALTGISIKTEDKSKFANRFGFKDQWSNLLELYPQLINESGKLNTSILESIINSENLGSIDKANLEQLLSYAKLGEEAYSKFGQYLSSVFGGVADEVTKAFQQMYESGDYSMKGLEESFSNMVEKFTTDAIQMSLLSPLNNQFNKVLENSNLLYSQQKISSAELQRDVVKALGQYYKGVSSLQPTIIEAYKAADSLAAANGFDLAFNGENNQSSINKSANVTSGMISGAITEETASVISGGINAIMLSNERIALNGVDLLDYAVQNIVLLNKIASDTGYLPEIASNTRKTYQKLENI